MNKALLVRLASYLLDPSSQAAAIQPVSSQPTPSSQPPSQQASSALQPMQIPSKGGIYIDDIRITNDDQVAYLYNFDDADISDWSPRPGASLVAAPKTERNRCVYLNRLDQKNTGMGRATTVDKIGNLRVAASVFLPAVSEQWGHNENRRGVECTYFYVYSGSSNDAFRFGVALLPDDPAYRCALMRYRSAVVESNGKKENGAIGGAELTTDTAVLAPLTWATIELRLNPATSIASLTLNGTQVLSCAYDPAQFTSLRNIEIGCWQGDQKWPDWPTATNKAQGNEDAGNPIS
jgi:hypothetical protein